MICDGSFPTYNLIHWTRDRRRGARIPLEQMVAMQTASTAALIGLDDRGMLRPGMRADVNVIDYDRLRLKAPTVAHDLPAGGRRLMQRAEGYMATIVAGAVTYRDGEPTGARPAVYCAAQMVRRTLWRRNRTAAGTRPCRKPHWLGERPRRRLNCPMRYGLKLIWFLLLGRFRSRASLEPEIASISGQRRAYRTSRPVRRAHPTDAITRRFAPSLRSDLVFERDAWRMHRIIVRSSLVSYDDRNSQL